MDYIYGSMDIYGFLKCISSQCLAYNLCILGIFFSFLMVSSKGG